MIGVVGYGLGNVHSIANMLRRIGQDVAICDTAKGIRECDRLILPGVGAFDAGVQQLNASGLRDCLEEAVGAGTPILGICLGMQLLGTRSDEGVERGLGFINAESTRLNTPDGLPLPHMGWNWVQPKPESGLFAADDGVPRFYFLHSYALRCSDDSIVTATATYGDTFVCAVASGNVYGVQFHPEKSHRFGMQVLRRFAQLS